MNCDFLTPLLVYKDLYESTYKDLINSGLTPDKASRIANIYCVKNTWRFFTSEDREAKAFRFMFYVKHSQWNKARFLVAEELNRLI